MSSYSEKCSGSLGAYLPFPGVSFAVSMKILWETLSRWRQNECESVEHESSPTANPKNRKAMIIASEEQRMVLDFFSDRLTEQILLFKKRKKKTSSRLFCSLYSKPAQLAFYLIRSTSVYTKSQKSFRLFLGKHSQCLQHNCERNSRLSVPQLVK